MTGTVYSSATQLGTVPAPCALKRQPQSSPDPSDLNRTRHERALMISGLSDVGKLLSLPSLPPEYLKGERVRAWCGVQVLVWRREHSTVG